MTASLQGVMAWYDGRVLRERVILATAALVVAVALFESLWWGPQRERTATVDRNVQALAEQKATLARSVMATASGSASRESPRV